MAKKIKVEEEVEEKVESKKKNSSLMVCLVAVMAIILIALIGYIISVKVKEVKEANQVIHDFHETYEAKEPAVIFYMHTGCQFCAMEEPILEQISKDYNLEYLTIDSSKISSKQKSEVLNALRIEGLTPTIVVVKDGKILATQVGYLDGHKLVEFFVEAGVLDDGSTYKPEENLNFINYEEFENLKKSGEKFLLTIGTATCDYCKQARPILSNIAKAYEIPIYYISLDYMARDDRINFFTELKDMKFSSQVFVSQNEISTPTVLVIEKGKVKSYIEGLQDTSTYVTYLKEQGFIRK